MVSGAFGVFDGTEILAEFGDDEAAEEYRSDALELNVPEGFRCSAYDDLQVCEKPDDYDQLHGALTALRRSRNQDQSVMSCLRILQDAQRVRAEALSASS